MDLETREIRTTALPGLDTGEVWATNELGVFVVVSQRAARWRGEDRDVYCDIDTWYTIRKATAEEQRLWDHAVATASARRAQRKQLGAGSNYEFLDGKLEPSASTRRVLDSYDDRWIPPASIILTPAQAAIEVAYKAARAALKRGVK